MKSSGLIHDFLKSRDHDKKDASNSRSTYRTKIVLYSICTRKAWFSRVSIHVIAKNCQERDKNEKNCKKLAVFSFIRTSKSKILITRPWEKS